MLSHFVFVCSDDIFMFSKDEKELAAASLAGSAVPAGQSVVHQDVSATKNPSPSWDSSSDRVTFIFIRSRNRFIRNPPHTHDPDYDYFINQINNALIDFTDDIKGPLTSTGS